MSCPVSVSEDNRESGKKKKKKKKIKEFKGNS